MWESGSPAHASSQPSPSAVVRHGDLRERQVEHGLGVVRDAAVPLAGVGLRLAHGQDRTAAERGGDVGGIGERERAVAEPRAGADDARADRADDGVVALRLGPGERRRRGDELRVAVEARRDGARDREQAALRERPHRVGQRHRQRAARDLDVRDARTGEPGADGRHLAVQRAEDDRHARRASRQLVRLLLATDRYLAGRVRQRHHVGALLRREPEPARQVRVEDVEAARAELEQPRLLVHEHVVPHLDLARQPRIGDAGDPVHLEPDEPGQRFDDRGDGSASKPERHRPAPASPRPSRRGRPPRCARRRCGSPSSRSPG